MPTNFSNVITILWTSFLNPHNLLNSSNFLKTFVFHSTSVYCFVFLAFDLWITSTLAFVHALLASKGLQAALALV